MLTRDIKVNFNTNELLDASNISVSQPYTCTYIENDYVIRATFVDDDNNAVSLVTYTSLDAGIGNIAGTSPLIEASNIMDTSLWADADLSTGKFVCKVSLTTDDIINDLGTNSIKTYYFQIIGNDEPIVDDEYTTLCNVPMFVKNTIWRS